MGNFKASEMIKLLNNLSNEDKYKKAQSSNEIKEEIKNVLNDTKTILYRQTREDAIKYILWQGLLNQYGIFGLKRSYHREFGKDKISYYDKKYSHGDIVSIDFGTTNLGVEFSFTHTALVMCSYTDYLVVVPITSCKEGRLENKPFDEQLSTLKIEKSDFDFIESNSYILLYQIRSVSKNRITKCIGSINNSSLLRDVDKKLLELILNPVHLAHNEQIGDMNKTIDKLNNDIKNKDKIITELTQKLKNEK